MPSVEVNIPIIVIAGPTASGKSGLALALAEKLNGVVINADSMQVYKDIPILAAAPSTEDQARVPHRLYGIYDAAVRGNVVDWLALCRNEIASARQKNKTPVVVGGTGFYLEALISGATPIPETPPAIRQEVADIFQNEGLEELYAYLQQHDTETAARLNPHDTTRICRAVEIIKHTGLPLSYWHRQPLNNIYTAKDFACIRIKPPRDILCEYIDKRFDAMLAAGAVAETRTLIARGLSDSLPAMRALGVQELKTYLENRCTLEEAAELAKCHSRQYAKRQTTWFNRRFAADYTLPEIFSENTGAGRHFLYEIVDKLQKTHKFLAK